MNDSDRTCTAVRKLGVYVFPLLYLAVALVNGSHGLGFRLELLNVNFSSKCWVSVH